MQVLLDDDLGRLTLRRLRPWHRMLAHCLAARLDRDLAGGARPESSALLAARAMRLTSMTFRRELAGSLRRMLAAAGRPPVPAEPSLSAARAPAHVGAPRVPVYRPRIIRFTSGLAELADDLVVSGPVPAQGVAMVTRLLADGTGPFYRKASADDLGVIIERASEALTG
ncbi:MAG: hypothetical protein ACRDPY_13640 [Streptosporangiaceae bacterium]